jgi:RNA polymerase sigma factor (TIGR02999 family)
MSKEPQTSAITELLRDLNEDWREDTAETLLKLVYEELHRQAHRYLRKERAGHTLQTTALVNEAYLKLIKQESVKWESRTHFFGIAATMMRRILIDYAKTRHRVRRGGISDDLPLENALTVSASDSNFDLLELDQALDRLTEKDAHLARVVEAEVFQRFGCP